MQVLSSLFTCSVRGHPFHVEMLAPAAPVGVPPLVVLLHGRDGPDGVVGDRGCRDLARSITQGGFCVILPHYFERTENLDPGITSNPLDQVGVEAEHFGLWLEAVGATVRASRKPSQTVGLLGYSLGGYLALTAAMTWRDVSAVTVYCGGIPTPFTSLASHLPPTLVLHGAADPVIPVKEAVALDRLLRRRRIPHDLQVYPGAGHGFCAADADDAMARVLAFFRKHLADPLLAPGP